MSRRIELLAPAKDVEVGVAAVRAGADAVYIGATSHGARSAASNSVDDIARLAEFAHQFGAKVYVTLNTLVYDNEITALELLAWKLYDCGVDAFIIQDMGVLKMKMPPVELHASTQCDIRDCEKASFLSSVGLKRVVVAREMGLGEIKKIHTSQFHPEIEAFCHGALCVCYSGACRASQILTGRSANRGECAQICRLPYDLVNENGDILIKKKHLLSLKDMNRIDVLGPMIDAGVNSFKIEGRLKDKEYVINAVAAYREALDKAIKERGLLRSSFGTTIINFTPDLKKGFNRGFTHYFLTETDYEAKIGSHDTPASAGTPIGKVIRINTNQITFSPIDGVRLANGDGLTFLTNDGLSGFRVNRTENNQIWVKDNVKGLKPGVMLSRNFDKTHFDKINKSISRFISVIFNLRLAGNTLCLDTEDERGSKITATSLIEPPEPSLKPQEIERKKILEKTGDTIYRVKNVSDQVGNIFIRASVLSELRRKALQLLEISWTCKREIRRRELDTSKSIATISKAENVSNRLSYSFYKEKNINQIYPAVEISPNASDNTLMTCRYCLRRELGKCLKKGAKKEKWFLKADGFKLALEFDCDKCEMKVNHGN